MSTGAKDSAEVVKFMTLFARLKDWCDDEPEQLADQAGADASVKVLCNRVYAAAQDPVNSRRSSEVMLFQPRRSRAACAACSRKAASYFSHSGASGRSRTCNPPA
jgi:hypothetical protein